MIRKNRSNGRCDEPSFGWEPWADVRQQIGCSLTAWAGSAKQEHASHHLTFFYPILAELAFSCTDRSNPCQRSIVEFPCETSKRRKRERRKENRPPRILFKYYLCIKEKIFNIHSTVMFINRAAYSPLNALDALRVSVLVFSDSKVLYHIPCCYFEMNRSETSTTRFIRERTFLSKPPAVLVDVRT